ncbi:hypothetical protein Scep_011515 [Stephania cephalantha]|uniref:Protein kinase domain-containing protein n=1 Tax=Stephania cephalantha TaxID=152367 RepID=A0AAP0JFG9_9MAGN
MLCGQPAFSCRPGETLKDFLDRIGVGGELPRIPAGISKEAHDFLKRCFVRNSKSRWNAGRLLSHPFLKEDTWMLKRRRRLDIMEKKGGEEAKYEELLQAQAHIYKHTYYFINSMSLKCAVELSIPDIIHNHHGKPMTHSELVTALQIPQSRSAHLYRLMRILVHNGFFATQKVHDHDDQEGYVLTLSSKLLLKDQKSSLCMYNLTMLDPVLLSPWQALSAWFKGSDDDEVNAFKTVHKKGIWEYMSNERADLYRLFNGAMAGESGLVSSVLVTKCKTMFEGLRSVVDVGGGVGIMARAIAEAFPRIKCTVLDLSHVVTSCQGSENLNFVAGDMFQSIPSADAVLIKGVLHDWSDEECVKILKRCREAISSKEEGGKVIIVDMVIDMKESTHESTEIQLMFDMEMMVEVTGKERTKHEWEKLFMEAGFITYKITPCLGLRNIHGGKTWEEVKHIAHGARNTTISLAKQVGLPQLVVVKYAAIDDSDTLQRQREVHAKFQGCPYILRCYGDEYCTAKDNGRIIYNVLFEHASGGNLADLIKTSRAVALVDYPNPMSRASPTQEYSTCPGFEQEEEEGAPASAAFDAKIADFWIAKSSKQIVAELRWEDRWCLEGTPRYMSPEVIAEHKKGPACDIWALGCVVVEMLCGQPAFSIKPGESLEAFLDRIGFGGESPRIPVGISREAQDFLKRCFVRNSKSRWNASRLLSHPFLKDHIPDAESPNKKVARAKAFITSPCKEMWPAKCKLSLQELKRN